MPYDLTEPTTRSPGFLTLNYTAATDVHKVSVRLLAGQDPGDFATLLTAATSLATAASACVPASTSFTGWQVEDAAHIIIHEALFDEPIVGTHSLIAAPYKSQTATITGRGAGGALLAAGQTRFVLFITGALAYTPGEKTFLLSSDSAFAALGANLTTSAVYWADFYGQKGSIRGNVTVQFNGHVQKALGT